MLFNLNRPRYNSSHIRDRMFCEKGNKKMIPTIFDYKNEITFIKELLLEKLDELSVAGIVAYGSITGTQFDENYSDIDIICFVTNYKDISFDNLFHHLEELNIDFKEKRPMRIIDALCDRVEFCIGGHIDIDVTLTTGLIPSRSTLKQAAWYDSFEALMGGVYLKGVCLYGRIPDYEYFKKDFLPFYSDELRKDRMNKIMGRLEKYNKRIRSYLDEKNSVAYDHIYKEREIFVKLLFIYYRQYFNTPEKNIYAQICTIDKLPDKSKKIIGFTEGTINYLAQSFVDLVDDFIQTARMEIA